MKILVCGSGVIGSLLNSRNTGFAQNSTGKR